MRLFLDDDRYYCFGCNARGDVVQWVRDAEDLDVRSAIRKLDDGSSISNAWAGSTTVDPSWGRKSAQRAAAELPDLTRTPPPRLIKVMAAAWSYYTTPTRHRLGTAYLRHRGVPIESLEQLTKRIEVGHTPPAAAGLVHALQKHGFREAELIDAGLASRRDDGPTRDVFRERVLFPVRDEGGHVCGLIGRNVGDDRWPKYLNCRRTAIYDKSVDLFKPIPTPLEPTGQVVVVEGPVDALAIASHAAAAGLAAQLCPITQSGRELSASQLNTVLTASRGPLILSFDADSAGRESAARYERELASAGHRVAITRLEEGEDPASWLARNGPSGLDTWADTQTHSAVIARWPWLGGTQTVSTAPSGLNPSP